ncbi:penicillin acylase family protein [Nocardioides sp. 503]|uniref:penicillin acylase family protein n=1 Tax=Nocardioides sp. 503 TaxID=2508326 RepID=UPI00106F0E3F|nr:penicillin acylase family protein [Nocardioides sp. 503]
MSRTYRDSFGIPHVRADSVLDLARGQGEVTANDRSWQLEWLRRRATGTTAEVLGPTALGWDRFARRTLVARTARRAHAALGDETRAFVAAYVAGVNAGLRADVHELEVLGVEPQPWEEWTPLAVFLAQHLLFANLGGKLWAQRSRDVLGADAALLSHEGPLPSGSNAWAVGGARTASGLPLIGGDPHRVIEAPGVYQQVRLACEDPDDGFDVVGLAFPGVPGVPHFAHAGDVAWAITNACGDYQDVYAEPTPYDAVEQWVESVPVRDGDPVDVEVVVTPRGAVFEDGLSLRTASLELGDLGFDAILPLLRARTVEDVDRALDHWVEPVNNVVVADRHGAVRYRLAGRVPLRPDAHRRGVVVPGSGTGWSGWLEDVHRLDVPPDGQVVTANERRGPESDAVGAVFAPPHRAERIHELLTGRDGLTPEDFAAIQDDAHLATVPALRALVPGAFDGWDGAMEAGSARAGAFAAWRSALVRRIAAEPVFAPLHEPRHDPLLLPWVDVTARIALALPTLASHGTPYGIDLGRLAREALEETAGSTAMWGETHVVTPVHAFDVYGDKLVAPHVPHLPVSGDSDCVRCTGSIPGLTDDAYRGSVARYVWDLADRQASAWVVPLGASGDPGDPHHHDQLALWAEGRLVPVVTDWARLTEQP